MSTQNISVENYILQNIFETHPHPNDLLVWTELRQTAEQLDTYTNGLWL